MAPDRIEPLIDSDPFADYCADCGVCHAYHPHPNADPHEPWECRMAEAKADRNA